MLYLVIHSSASQRPWVRTPDTTLTSFRSIWIHWYWSLNLDSHAHLTKIHIPSYLFIWGALCDTNWRLGGLDSPKALVVKASLVRDPGGVPAGVLVLTGAADLVWGHRSRFKSQRSVVRTFCERKHFQVTVALNRMNSWKLSKHFQWAGMQRLVRFCVKNDLMPFDVLKQSTG